MRRVKASFLFPTPCAVEVSPMGLSKGLKGGCKGREIVHIAVMRRSLQINALSHPSPPFGRASLSLGTGRLTWAHNAVQVIRGALTRMDLLSILPLGEV